MPVTAVGVVPEKELTGTYAPRARTPGLSSLFVPCEWLAASVRCFSSPSCRSRRLIYHSYFMTFRADSVSHSCLALTPQF